jgi:hypothetical protein
MQKIKLSFQETLPEKQQPKKSGTSEAIYLPATETKKIINTLNYTIPFTTYNTLKILFYTIVK